jgi:polyhydroxyalkanoate synthesis regulator phasin
MVTRKVSEPVQDAVKAYLELAMGLTEASKKRAEKTVKKVARELMGKGGATANQLQGMAEDLVNTGMANREAVNRLVRVEMDRALGRLGLATADEVATLTDRIDSLERQLRDDKAGSAPARADGEKSEPVVAAHGAPVKKAVAKKALAKKAGEAAVPAVKRAPAKKAVTESAATKKAATKKAASKAAPTKAATKKAASKAATKKAATTKAVTKKAAAEKATTKAATKAGTKAAPTKAATTAATAKKATKKAAKKAVKKASGGSQS